MARKLVRLFLRIRHIRNAVRLASFRQRDPRISQACVMFPLLGVVCFLRQCCAPGGRFPCGLALGSHLVLPHFDYHSLTSCIMRSPRILRAGVSHFSLRKKRSWKQAKGLLWRWHYVAAGVARIADRTTAYLKPRPLGTPLGGLCCLVGAADAEAAMTAFASRAAVNRVCLADQARGCEDDARDECS
jgi:hypothetical protein